MDPKWSVIKGLQSLHCMLAVHVNVKEAFSAYHFLMPQTSVKMFEQYNCVIIILFPMIVLWSKHRFFCSLIMDQTNFKIIK